MADTRYAGLLCLTKAAQWRDRTDLVPQYTGTGKPNYKPLVTSPEEWAMRKSLGDNPGIGRMAASLGGQIGLYAAPISRTVYPLLNAGADAINVFSPGATWKQRLGHAGSAVGNTAFAGLGLLMDAGTLLTGGLGAPAASAISGAAGAAKVGRLARVMQTYRGAVAPAAKALQNAGPVGKYMTNTTAWQQRMRAGAAAAKARGGVTGTLGSWGRGALAHPMTPTLPLMMGSGVLTAPEGQPAAGFGVGQRQQQRPRHPWYDIDGALQYDATTGTWRPRPGPAASRRLGMMPRLPQQPVPYGTGGMFQPQLPPDRNRGLYELNPYDKPEDIPFGEGQTPWYLRQN